LHYKLHVHKNIQQANPEASQNFNSKQNVNERHKKRKQKMQKDIARRSCAMVPRRRFLTTFLRPVFAASREQHISDLHAKFALGPRHV